MSQTDDKIAALEKRIIVMETEARFLRMVGAALVAAIVGLIVAMIGGER